MNIVVRILTAPFQWILFKDTLQGAQTQIRLAVDKYDSLQLSSELLYLINYYSELETVTGKYFSDCREAWTLCTARNDGMAKWLWDKSEELTGHFSA